MLNKPYKIELYHHLNGFIDYDIGEFSCYVIDTIIIDRVIAKWICNRHKSVFAGNGTLLVFDEDIQLYLRVEFLERLERVKNHKHASNKMIKREISRKWNAIKAGFDAVELVDNFDKVIIKEDLNANTIKYKDLDL